MQTIKKLGFTVQDNMVLLDDNVETLIPKEQFPPETHVDKKAFLTLLNAHPDTKILYEIITEDDIIRKTNIFNFGEKKVELNPEQMDVVEAPFNKNIRILACAGSGKTTNIICRIKRLSEEIEASSIILTTFTRDASFDMQNKLASLVPDHEVTVGTIDSIAVRTVCKYARELLKNKRSVSEYIHIFYEFLKKADDEKRNDFIRSLSYLFVDEFNDINEDQYKIIRLLNENGVIITAIGDDAQNIYTFRGSNVKYILNFDKDFKNTQSFKLVKNYRATPELVALANDSISHNRFQIPKNMIATKPSIGKKPTVKYCWNWDNEKDGVFEMILQYIADGVPLHDIAVLSRNTKGKLTGIENKLVEHQIKCVLLDNEIEKIKMRRDHITLSTIHKSKGMEWTVVFLMGADDDYLPADKTLLGLEEERRLFYVGITRAKQYLHITYTSKKMSRFLTEVNPNHFEWISTRDEHKKKSNKPPPPLELSVTELVKNLRTEDFKNLRLLGILPNLNNDKEKLYNDDNWHKFVEDINMYAEFGTFVDLLVTRFIEERDGKINDDSTAKYVIASVKLEPQQLIVYQKYMYNFIQNASKLTSECDVVKTLENTNGIHNLELKERMGVLMPKIEEDDYPVLFDLVEKILNNSKKYNIPPHRVLIISERLIPDMFETELETAYEKYKNINRKTNNIIKDVFDVSKSHGIKEGRLRLLYLEVSMDNLEEYKQMYKNIETVFVPKMTGKNICKMILDYERDGDIVLGEADLINEDNIIECKCSGAKDKLEYYIQLLCYTYMAREKGIVINKISVYNPLLGEMYVTDISTWNKGKELMDYLLDLRETLMLRNIKDNDAIHNII